VGTNFSSPRVAKSPLTEREKIHECLEVERACGVSVGSTITTKKVAESYFSLISTEKHRRLSVAMKVIHNAEAVEEKEAEAQLLLSY